MAQRRMTSLEVTGTDAFLDMPQSSQLLYFHLNSLADDDGFVANPKSVMRNCGSQADDLKLLLAKKFVIAFEDGVCVIKHWRINNFIRKDIYRETKYLDLKGTLFIRKNGAYTLTDDNRAIPVPKGHFNVDVVNETLTNRQPRIGKIRKGKDIEESCPFWLNKEAWKDWETHRREKKKPLTPLSTKKQLKMLENYKKDHVEIIETSIRNGWTGLFPPKGEQPKFRSDHATAHQKRIEHEEDQRERSQDHKNNEKRAEIDRMSKDLTKKFTT